MPAKCLEIFQKISNLSMTQAVNQLSDILIGNVCTKASANMFAKMLATVIKALPFLSLLSNTTGPIVGVRVEDSSKISNLSMTQVVNQVKWHLHWQCLH